ncbi:MAG: chemotaxis protein CheX [Planctomycetes bacterium]|nr:chemotaxis protein CheX [Planctomycetota bacterium]
MQSLEREVVSIAQGVWSMILGLELRPLASVPAANGPAVVGRVGISGAWEGQVTLRCPAAMAARAASILFGVTPNAAAPDQTRDVVGELTNVLGGNIKALLPEPCRLSLPAVDEEQAARAPTRAVVVEVALSCEGQPVVVTVAGAAT